jgi:hypothetical protein
MRVNEIISRKKKEAKTKEEETQVSQLQSQEQIKTWYDLYYVDKDHVPTAIKNSKNRHKSWKYGYDKQYDLVIISKDGTLGDVYDINGLKIGLPKKPKDVPKGKNKWVATPIPEELKRFKTTLEWKKMPHDFRSKHIDYITEEFDRRKQGYWFTNNGKPTYVTGHHYMYLQHTKIDIGLPDYREANRVFFIYWEACKADSRCFGMIYLKIRRSGFSYMGSSINVDTATLARDARLGILSKTGADAKQLFTGKVVPISANYPFFFKPIQDGMDRPKSELSYRVPAERITKKNMHRVGESDGVEGLDTSIDWKNTDDNSYDGEKLLYLLHDESSKWIKPLNIITNWKVTRTCLRLGSKIIGKCLMGSTCNALSKGGDNFKSLYDDSDPNERTKNGQTKSGMYRLFIPMEWNFEGYIDEFGFPVFETPDKPVMGVDGEEITQGVIEYWENEAEGLKHDPPALNEFYRQFPRTESHAFRDESNESIFNLTKIYDQIEYNESLGPHLGVTRGNFHWKDGKKDTEVIWSPDNRSGRFYVSWHPPDELKNNVRKEGDKFYPGNKNLGGFGCDPYDIAGVVGGGGSKGALHGLTTSNLDDRVPSNKFVLEYISRPSTAEIFFEDCLMALHYFGMPVLAENNKAGFLKHLLNRGYRAFSLDRPDKPKNQLSKSEKRIGGMPNTSEDTRQLHASCVESYIEQYVGYDVMETYRDADECGDMPFMRTLQDWAKFDPFNRTKHDATISSGFAIIATRKDIIKPPKEYNKISVPLYKYDNRGSQSKIIS